jgi:hypothetical protein
MNSFWYCGAEHNFEPTGVQTASNHACKRFGRIAELA